MVLSLLGLAKKRRPAGVSFDSVTPNCDWVSLTSHTQQCFEPYLGSLHVDHVGAKQQRDGLVAPAYAADLCPRVVGDYIQNEFVDAQDPLVLLARVGVPSANDDQIKGLRVWEVLWLICRIEEGEGDIVGNGADGACVRVPDFGDEGRAVRVEEDGHVECPGV